MDSFSKIILTILLAMAGQAWAAPGDILFQDNFERSNPGNVGNGWTVTAAAGDCDGVLPTTVTPESFPKATITIGGSQKVPVNGITVGGQQIMAASYAGSTNTGTVATNIRDQINACTSATSGNCTVAGYSASRSGSVVTITGPSTATGKPTVSLGTPSGNGTTETFTATSFTAYTQGTYTYTSSTNTGCAGIDKDVPPWNSSALPLAPRANDNSRTLFTRWATVTVDSPAINLAGKPGAQITFWLRRGSDCFSEWPGNNQAGCNATLAQFTSLLGEEFQVQYKNSSGNWLVLAQYPTDAIPGEIFRPTIDLPTDALWSGFQLRFRQPSGSGFSGTSGGATGVRGYDYWHLDDVKVTEVAETQYSGGFCDTFEGDLSRWTFIGTGNAEIGSTYFQNGVHGLDIRWGPVVVTSKATDISTVTDKITFWLKRGTGNVTKVPNTTASDQPESGKDLVIEYLTTTAGVWKSLVPAATFVGGSTGGQVWCPVAGTNCPAASVSANTNVAIPADANRTAFQLRFRLTGGAGYDQDYWHLDDICVGKVVTGTDLSLVMAPAGTTTLSPGATSTITYTVTNVGPNVEPGAISIKDTLPGGLSFVSSGNWSSGSWPVGFTGCTTVGQVLTCTRTGSLAVGASVTLTITVQADANAAGSNLANVAVVGGQSLEIASANNTATNYYTFSLSAFEAYETTTTPTSAIVGRIFTKLAATPFALKVIAINAGAINTAYNKAVTVDLISGSAACLAGTAALTGVTISPTSPYSYVIGDAGVHTFSFTSTNANPNVRVRIKDNTAIGCSSDNFAIRPSAATLNVTPTMATAPSAADSHTVKAGATFTLQASTSASGSYSGTLTQDGTKLKAQNPAQSVTLTYDGSVGALTPTSLTSNAAAVNAKYGEVGYLYLTPGAYRDDDFTVVDQASGDCIESNTGDAYLSDAADVNNKFGCSIGNKAEVRLGRFIPDHFDTAVVATSGVPMPCPLGLTCPPAYDGFVYSGQPFSLQVTAKNADGNTTQNYSGAFAKAVSLSAVGDSGGSAVPTISPGGILSAATVAASGFSAGSNSASLALPIFSFAAAQTSPTDIYVRAVEASGADDVSSLRVPASSSVEGGVKVVSGRIKFPNMYGSERLPLAMTATVQFYDLNGNWVTSSTDSTSAVAVGTPVIVNGPLTIGNLTSTTVTDSCLAPTKFCAGVKGFFWSSSNVAGSANILLNVPNFLPFLPARATFGIYKSPLIYRRENY